GARPRGRAHQRLDQIHHANAGVDVDAGAGIGQPLLRHLASSPSHRRRDRGIRRRATLAARVVRRNLWVCNGLIVPILAIAASVGRRWSSGEGQALVRAHQAARVAGRWLGRDARVSIPNLVTLGRILLVPVVVWAITAGELRIAFALFLAAGITDAVDGF